MKKTLKTASKPLALQRETLANLSGGGGVIVIPHPQNPDPQSRYCGTDDGRW